MYGRMKINNIHDIVLPAKGPVVFITGVTGQDGSHMVDYLLKNTEASVIGGARRLSVDNHANILHLEHEPRFQLVNFDLTDSHSVHRLVQTAKPDYFINFAAQSFVASSWDFALQTWETNSTGVLNCLEAIRNTCPNCRFYNAGSSEEFGNVTYEPQDEKHPLRPRSPYGASKAAARQLVKVYRESFDIYAVQGWLFNHEGTRRGKEFVTRKITHGVAQIVRDRRSGQSVVPIELGNMDAKRDWSDAEDLMDAVWRMLNHDKYNSALGQKVSKWYQSLCSDGAGAAESNRIHVAPRIRKELAMGIKDYVVSSGTNHSIREFVTDSFEAAGIKGQWENVTINDPLKDEFVEVGSNTVLVKVNPKFYRPAEIDNLRGNSSLILKDLGWTPKTTFQNLVRKMVENDLRLMNLN